MHRRISDDVKALRTENVKLEYYRLILMIVDVVNVFLLLAAYSSHSTQIVGVRMYVSKVGGGRACEEVLVTVVSCQGFQQYLPFGSQYISTFLGLEYDFATFNNLLDEKYLTCQRPWNSSVCQFDVSFKTWQCICLKIFSIDRNASLFHSGKNLPITCCGPGFNP